MPKTTSGQAVVRCIAEYDGRVASGESATGGRPVYGLRQRRAPISGCRLSARDPPADSNPTLTAPFSTSFKCFQRDTDVMAVLSMFSGD